MDTLQFVRAKRAYLLAYAIMPDHLHLVLALREGYTVSSVLQTIKGYTARVINARNGARGPLWQRSFYDRMIGDEQGLWDILEYVDNNPVVAGLVEKPEDYAYSSAGRPEMVDLQEFYG